MAKKIKNMSLAMNADMQSLLRVSAMKLDCSVSELVRKLINNYLPLVMEEGEGNSTSLVFKVSPDKVNPQVVEKLQNIVSSFEDNEAIPIVLKVPKELRGNQDAVEKWLQPRIKGIVQALG